MKRLVLFFILLFTTVVFFGCAAPIKLTEYREMDRDLKSCEIKPPDYVINKKKPKVAILPFEDVTDFKGKLAKPANEAMVQTLSAGTGLEILERSQVDKLFAESKFKESLGGSVNYSMFSNLVNIDFVVLGSISSATVKAQYSEASSYKDDKGKYQRIPASCTVNAQAILNVRAISTKDGTIYKVFEPFKGGAGTYSEGGGSCRVQNGTQLAISATIKAVQNAKDDFMDAFPTYGYVAKTMTNLKTGKDRVAVISLGRNDGVKVGDKLMIAKYVKSHDRIKNTDSLVIQDIGEVEINETGLSDNQSFVMIPEELTNDILPGDIVKTKADRSFLGTLKKNMPL